MHVHIFTLVTSVFVWILVAMWLVYEVAVHDYTESLIIYASCDDLLEDYPLGIAAEWAPRIGPTTVLNETIQNGGTVWKKHSVSTINNRLYVKQHYWLDGDSDGIMCERAQQQPV